MKKKITLKYLQESRMGVMDTIDHARSFGLDYPIQPNRPILVKKHTSEDVKKYQEELSEYEIKYSTYQEEYEKIRNHNNDIEYILEEYIKDVSGLYTIVPKQYQDKLYAKAYSDGHSAGIYEVYGCLTSLIYIFEE
jgi:hypothetical protein